jgi:hypothetical protein
LPPTHLRVFISRVRTDRGLSADPRGQWQKPEGPHTHVLPNLPRAPSHPCRDRTDTRRLCSLRPSHPAHPLRDGLGHSLPFDAARHDAFQNLLRTFGDPEFLRSPARGRGRRRGKPSVVTVTDKRFARANVRVTLRQLKAANAESPSLAAWMAAHERPGEIDTDEDEERHRHHR